MPASGSTVSAPRDRLRRTVQKRRFSSGDGWSARERERSREISDDSTRMKITKSFSLHEEHLAQQWWEAEQRLRVETARIAAQSSTQLNAEFRTMRWTRDTDSACRRSLSRLKQKWMLKDAESLRKQQKNSDDEKLPLTPGLEKVSSVLRVLKPRLRTLILTRCKGTLKDSYLPLKWSS